MSSKNSKPRTKNSYLDPASEKRKRWDRADPGTQTNSTTNSTTSRRQPPVPRKGNRKKPS